MAKKSKSPKLPGVGSSASELVPKAICFGTPSIMEQLNIVVALWPTIEGEESPGFLVARNRLHEALRIDETLWQSTGEPIPKNKYEMEVLLARIGENDLVKSGNWTPRKVTSLIVGGLKRELNRAKPETKSESVDDTLADILTKQQLAIVKYLWGKPRGVSFDVLQSISGAWRDCPGDDAVEKALKRTAEKFNEYPSLEITLEISTAKQRVKLNRPPDK
jgi:hypothetical protein